MRTQLTKAQRARAQELDSGLNTILDSTGRLSADQLSTAQRTLKRLHESANGGELGAPDQAIWDALTARLDEPAKRYLSNGEEIGRESTIINGDMWRDQRGQEVRVYQRGEQIAQGHDYRGVSFGGMLRAMVAGARTDDERRALAEGTGSAGGYTVPTPLSAQFFDLMRAKSACAAAGMQTVIMDSSTLKLAKLTGDVPCAWRAENAAVATGDPTFGVVTLTAQSVAGSITVSRELIADSVNVEQMLSEAIAERFAAEIDRVCLVGSGTPPEPKGIKNQSGVSIAYTGTNGGVVTFDHLLDLRETLESANTVPSAYIWAPRTARAVAGERDSVGQWVALPEWLRGTGPLADGAQPVLFLGTSAMPVNETRGTANNASSIIAGQFASLILGLREQVHVEVVPGLGAGNGQVTLIAHARADCTIVRATDFAVLSGVTPS